MVRLTSDIRKRFEAKINKTDTCWLWTASKYLNGYGQVNIRGTNTGAHRVSYRLYKGTIPKGKHIMHTCDVRGCVNPAHLVCCTRLQNMQDAAKKKRIPYGEGRFNTKLTEAEALEILNSSEKESQKSLAKRYGISRSQVYRIKNGLRWKYLSTKVNQ